MAPEPSRRTFIGHLAGATAAAGVVYGCADLGAATLAGRDAELLAACADYHAAWNAIEAWEAQPEPGFDTPETDADEEYAATLFGRLKTAISKAGSLPAHTRGGLRAKAEVMRLSMSAALNGHSLETSSPAVKLALSLHRDVVRLTA